MSAAMWPPLVRALIFPLHERIMRRPTFAYFDELERTQWLSREAIERLQMDRLKALLQTAEAHSPWHAQRIRAAGIDLRPEAPLTIEALRRLPLMDKQDAREHVERIVWREVPGGAFRYTTGGSSGQPLIFYYGRTRQASDAANRMRARRWWGVEVGDREVFLWGAPVELNKTDRIKRLRDRLVNQLLLNAFEMSAQNMDAYIEAIQAYRPRCIYGYASSLALLAAHAQDRGRRLSLPDLRVVCATGEPLYPHQRSLIREVFQAPVAGEYGSRDAGFIAHESPQGQMLMMSESNVMELVDERGDPVAPGEMGEVVITGLCSQAQPFIRYRTGDVARLGAAPCRAGRGLHVIEEVMGRTTDFVVRADGTIMHALAVIYVIRETPGVAEFKFVQHTVSQVEIQIVPGALWSDGSAAQIVAGIRNRLGTEVAVQIQLVEGIAPEASGKHRYVVSHVPLQERLGSMVNT